MSCPMWLGRPGPTSTAQTWKGQTWKIRWVWLGGGIGYYTVHLLVMPAEVREARAHFNCPDLEG